MKLGTYLADSAARYPDKIAYVCDDERVTFAELEDRAERLYWALTRDGLAPGDRVAVYLPNGSAVVDAMAAIALAGAIIVPISTRLSSQEVQYILDDADASVVIFDPEFRDTIAAAHVARGFSQRIVVGEAQTDEVSFATLLDTPNYGHAPSLPLAVDDLVLGYTSGTSGRPKGAVGTHRAMIMTCAYMNPIEFGMDRHDRLLITSPMAHRVGLSRMVNMLCMGCTIVIMARFDPEQALQLIRAEQVSVVSVVPTIARLMLPHIERDPGSCASLQKLLATGEAFPVALKERLLTALPSLELYTSYAQTEGGLIASLRPEEQLARPESVGRPVPGVEVRLVDADLNDVSPGNPGEALVRFGPPGELMVMREYHNRPDANAETLLDEGWMRTGDLLRRDEAGYLYFVDRAKDMIVSGGLNIYAKEVELALIAHPSVADAAVIGIPDDTFGEAVVAYVEREPTADEVSEAGLIEHCRTTIASYKKPKFIRFEAALPRTMSGKVRKGELRDRESQRAQG